jgi:hypothetical protein
VTAEGHRRIRAPVQRVWHLLSRLESHPRYVTLWFAADLLERSPASALVEFRGFFGGLPLTSVQRLTLKAPARMEFRQTRGELREFTGAYLLKEADGDTDLVCQLAVDAGIPLFTDASVQQILISHIDGTLSRIKAAAERDLVRLVPRRPRLIEAAAPASEPAVPAADAAEEDAAAAETPDEPDADAAPPAVAGGRVAAEPPAAQHRAVRQGRRRRRRRGRRGSGPGAARGVRGC